MRANRQGSKRSEKSAATEYKRGDENLAVSADINDDLAAVRVPLAISPNLFRNHRWGRSTQPIGLTRTALPTRRLPASVKDRKGGDEG